MKIGVVIFLLQHVRKHEYAPSFREDTSLALSALESGKGLHTFPKSMVEFFWHFGYTLCALLFASLKIAGGASPFSLAFLAALPPQYAISAAFGSATGYILTEDSVSALRYVAAILCIVVLSKLLYRLEARKHARVLSALIGFFAAFLTAVAIITAEGLTVKGFLSALAEGALTGLYTFFFARGLEGVKELQETKTLSKETAASFAFCLFLLLDTFSDFALWKISFSRSLAVFFCLWMSQIYTEKQMPALFGIAMTFAFLFDEAVGKFAILYLLCGTAVCFVLSLKPYRTAAVFIAIFTFGMLLLGDVSKSYLLLEVLLGATVFCLMPHRFLYASAPASQTTSDADLAAAQKTATAFRLHRTAKAMEEIATTVESLCTVSKICTTRHTKSEEAGIFTRQILCESCALAAVCKEKHKAETEKAFLKMQEKLEENKLVQLGDLPPVFRSRCLHADLLTESMNRRYLRLCEQEKATRMTEEVRRATAENLKGLCAILKNLSEETSKAWKFDLAAEEKVERTLFRECNLRAKAVSCRRVEDQFLNVEILFGEDSDAPSKKADICGALEEALSLRLSPSKWEKDVNGVRLILMESPKYAVDFAYQKAASKDAEYCGDNLVTFYDDFGNFYVALSDGMGQGKRAALDSALTLSFFKKLITGGFSPASAMQNTNALLLLKAEESLSTLDVLKINLYTGNATFYKAGSTKSLLLRKGKLQSVAPASMPLGILEVCHFASVKGKLSPDDLVLIASDGIFDSADQKVSAAFLQNGEKSMPQLSEKLLKVAKEFTPKKHVDDMTVFTLKFLEKMDL